MGEITGHDPVEFFKLMEFCRQLSVQRSEVSKWRMELYRQELADVPLDRIRANARWYFRTTKAAFFPEIRDLRYGPNKPEYVASDIFDRLLYYIDRATGRDNAAIQRMLTDNGEGHLWEWLIGWHRLIAAARDREAVRRRFVEAYERREHERVDKSLAQLHGRPALEAIPEKLDEQT